MRFLKKENVEGGRGPSAPEWAAGWTLNTGVRAGLIEMPFDQTPQEVWEEGEEHSKPF